MNGRQAARAAAEMIEKLEQRIAELEHYNRLCARDITLYNGCILSMINHGSPCEYCHDLEECREAGKDLEIGCEDWMLKMWKVGEDDDGRDHDEEHTDGEAPAGGDAAGGVLEDAEEAGATEGV